MHQVQAAEDHGLGAARLHAGAVHRKLHVQVLRVAHLVGRGQPGPQGVERIARLAFGPLPAPLELEGPFRDVVGDAIPADVFGSLFRGSQVTGIFPDHDAQLHLPVGLFAAPGDEQGVVGPHHRVGPFLEDDGFFRDGHPAFFGMVGVVQADAEHLAGPGYARGPPRIFGHIRQGGAALQEALQLPQPAPVEKVAVPVMEMPGEVLARPL